MPTMASALSLGCQRAVSCVNEARVTVSMVTSPACHPSSSPSSTAFGVFSVRSRPCGGRERRSKRGRSLSKEQPGKSQSVHYLCRCFDSLRWSGNGNEGACHYGTSCRGLLFFSTFTPCSRSAERQGIGSLIFIILSPKRVMLLNAAHLLWCNSFSGELATRFSGIGEGQLRLAPSHEALCHIGTAVPKSAQLPTGSHSTVGQIWDNRLLIQGTGDHD